MLSLNWKYCSSLVALISVILWPFFFGSDYVMHVMIVFFISFNSTTLSAGNLVQIQNEYLKASVDIETSRFFISSTDGDPENDKDDNQMLLYYSGTVPASYSKIMLDGTPYIVGGAKGYYERNTIKKNFS